MENFNIDNVRQRTFEARKNKGLQQEEVASLMGVSRTTYAQYEARSAITAKNLIPFCLAVDTDPYFILNGMDIKEVPGIYDRVLTPELGVLIDDYSKLSPVNRKTIQDMVGSMLKNQDSD